MTFDAVMLIDSDHYGNPSRGSGLGHFVRVTDRAKFRSGDQLTDRGSYPHADCWPEVMQDILEDMGHPEPIRVIEAASGTTSTGTLITGAARALNAEHIPFTLLRTPPPAGRIGNPIGGRILPASEFPAYKAAFAGYTFMFTGSPAPAPRAAAPKEIPTSFHATVKVDVANVWSAPVGGKLFGYHPRKGQVFQIDRYARVSTPVGRDHRWYHINTGGWIAGARVSGAAPGTRP